MVRTNKGIAQAWASRQHEAGSATNGTLYFRGPVIYSYNDGWPLAAFLPDGSLLVNSDRYSVTTSRHRGLVLSASHSSRIMYRDREEMKKILKQEGL